MSVGSVVMILLSSLVLAGFLEWVQSVALTDLWMLTKEHLLRVKGSIFLSDSCLPLSNRLTKKVIMGKG